MWIVIGALAAALIAACIGGWVYYHEPRDYDPDDRYGDYTGYYDDDYFSDIQDAIDGEGRVQGEQGKLWETGQMPKVGGGDSIPPQHREEYERELRMGRRLPTVGELRSKAGMVPDWTDPYVQSPSGQVPEWTEEEVYEFKRLVAKQPWTHTVQPDLTTLPAQLTDADRAAVRAAFQGEHGPELVSREGEGDWWVVNQEPPADWQDDQDDDPDAWIYEGPGAASAAAIADHVQAIHEIAAKYVVTPVQDDVCAKRPIELPTEQELQEQFTGQFEAIKDKQERPDLYVSHDEWMKQQEDELSNWRTRQAIELAQWRAKRGLSSGEAA